MRHRAGFPDDTVADLQALGMAGAGESTGEHVVDLGAGTGNLTRLPVGAGCATIGLGIAEPMLDAAHRIAAERGLNIDFRVAPAESTGLDPGGYDGVTSGQCWHRFDRPAVAAECRRILRPGGWIAMVHFDWLPLRGNVVEATERPILRHNPEWRFAGGCGLHPQWLTDLREGGFVDIVSRSRDVDVRYSWADWRGRIRASAGVAASLSSERVVRFDSALGALLAERGDPDPPTGPHRLFIAAGRKPA